MIKSLIQQFQLEGRVSRYAPYGSGHINDSYKVETGNGNRQNYLFQKVNHHVFKYVPELMDNILRVTSHLRDKLDKIEGADPDRESLTLVKTLQGNHYCQDEAGNYYRMFLFIEDHKSFDIVQTGNQAYEAGRMFGRFQNLMSDLPGEPLHETIRDFHNIEFRLNSLFKSLHSDDAKRASGIRTEIRFVEKRMDEMKILLDLSRKGKIPTRITHNDTKCNNVLLDMDDKGLCVIDLDTVMPGLAHYDFGDAIRTSTNTAAEDEAELDRVEMNINLYEAFSRGFLKEMASLTETEIEYLPLAAKLFPYIMGVRFLTDYLDGDKYFKTKSSEHNLQRCRSQFKLLTSMESQYEKMVEIISRINEEYKS